MTTSRRRRVQPQQVPGAPGTSLVHQVPAGYEPQQVLGSEDEDADGVEAEERIRVAFTARRPRCETVRTTNRKSRVSV